MMWCGQSMILGLLNMQRSTCAVKSTINPVMVELYWVANFVGCACVTANREGSVRAIVNLQRLKGEDEIEKYFEKWQIEETL